MTNLKTAPTTLPAPPWADPPPALDPVTRQSIGLGFAFNGAILADPRLLVHVPAGAVVVLVPSDDPELATHEIDSGIAMLRQGCDVYVHHFRPAHRVATATAATD